MDSTDSTLEAMLQEVPSELMPEPTKSCFGSDDCDGDDDDDDDDDGSEGKTRGDETWKRLSAELEPDSKIEDGHGQDDNESIQQSSESKKACIQNQSRAEDTKSGPHAILPRNPVDAKWLMRFDELAAYHKENGHCNIKGSENISLYKWVLSQRRLFKSRNLDEDRKRKLDSIRFDWTKKPLKELFEEKWNSKFDELAAFHKKNGHCSVRKSENPSLYIWVYNQRQAGLNNKLREDRTRQLDLIGFEWDTGATGSKNPSWKKALDAKWKLRFGELVVYQEKNGHCNVTRRENATLYEWVRGQRRLGAKNVAHDRKSQLDSIGFDWDGVPHAGGVTSSGWDEMFKQLQQFRKSHGHCNVTIDEDQLLFRWLSLQRNLFGQGGLSERQKQRLESIDGFYFVPEAKGTKDVEEMDELVVDSDDELYNNANDAHGFSEDDDAVAEEGLELEHKRPSKSEATNMSRKKRRISTRVSPPQEQENRKPVLNRAFSSSSSRAWKARPSADSEVVYGARCQIRFGTMVLLQGTPHPKPQYEFRYEDGTTEILSGEEAQEAYDLGMSEKESYLQKRVAKMFDGRPFAGTIVSFREVDNRPHWKVEYDNGKEEELDVDDVKRFISLFNYIRLMGS